MTRLDTRYPAILDLASRLKVSRTHAIGTILVLQDFCDNYAPQGDVGKWSNKVIALACDWEGDPEEFVNALVNSGWLERSPEHRLLVGDFAFCEEEA